MKVCGSIFSAGCSVGPCPLRGFFSPLSPPLVWRRSLFCVVVVAGLPVACARSPGRLSSIVCVASPFNVRISRSSSETFSLSRSFSLSSTRAFWRSTSTLGSSLARTHSLSNCASS